MRILLGLSPQNPHPWCIVEKAKRALAGSPSVELDVVYVVPPRPPVFLQLPSVKAQMQEEVQRGKAVLEQISGILGITPEHSLLRMGNLSKEAGLVAKQLKADVVITDEA